MDADLKARLRDELDAHQDEYGLDEVFYLSFHRRMHYDAAVSAADVVYSVSALLEAWQGPPGSAADPAALLGAARTPEEEAAANERIFTARFHEAYDALSGQDEQKLTEGIHLAMALQKAIFRVAVSLHDKKAVRALDHFRWAVVHNNLASAEDYLLMQPMAITRLAQLMIDVSREERSRAQARQGPNARALWRPKPLLVFAERRNTYLGGWAYTDADGEKMEIESTHRLTPNPTTTNTHKHPPTQHSGGRPLPGAARGGGEAPLRLPLPPGRGRVQGALPPRRLRLGRAGDRQGQRHPLHRVSFPRLRRRPRPAQQAPWRRPGAAAPGGQLREEGERLG